MMKTTQHTCITQSHRTRRPLHRFIACAVTALVMFFSFPYTSRCQINTDRMMMIARNALAYDDYVLSISYFNVVINYKPYLYEPYFFRGVAKFYLDDYSGTVSDCTQAINRNPYYPNSYELRGLAYINLERYSEAAADYKKATEFNPEERGMWHNLALCYINMDSLNLADSVADVMTRKWTKYADGYCLKAQIMLEKKDTLEALDVAKKAVEADRFNANALTLQANLLMWHEDYKEAIDSYTEAIRLDPKQAGSLINRALCYYHTDRYREAMADYDKALDMDPNNFVGHYNRGLLRANVGEDNLAIEDFNFILAADPSDMMATFNRATLLDNTGDYRGAIRDYTTVIKEYPKFLLGYEKRAEARRKIGDIAGARRDEEHVLKEQIAKRYGYSTPTSRMKNKTRKKSEFNIEDYNKMVEEDEQEQSAEYASEYRGKVQNKQNDGKLMLPNQRTYTIYKEAGKEDVLKMFEKAFHDAQSGNINEAILGFDKVIETNPSIAEAYYDRGLLKLLIDDNIGAIPDLSKAGEMGIYQAYSVIKKNQKIQKKSSK
ncbi:MAG: tetratricopeptide repeat protein [bacterium]|nr:tetratricopeptide repeat protein [bacterium]